MGTRRTLRPEWRRKEVTHGAAGEALGRGRGATRRRGLGVGTGVVPAVLLAACAPGASQAPAASPARGPVTVRLATDWLEGPRGDTLKMAVPAFEQQHPEIKVAVEAITGDYFTVINTQIAAGTIQEVVLFEGNFFQSFKDQGAFTAIDQALKQQKVSMADHSVVPGIYQDQGKQYGMPFQLVLSGWYYNVDLFEERGLKPPDERWTWDDVLAAAQALTRPERGQYGIHVTNGDQFVWGPLLFSAGARWHNADRTRTLLADQGGSEAFQWVIDLIHRHRVSPAPGQVAEVRGAFGSPFLAGKVGMLPGAISGSGGTVRNVADRFRWDIMPTPKHPKTGKATHVWNDQPHVLMNVAGKLGVTEQATSLIIFLAGEVVQGRVAVDRGSIPVLKKLQTGPEYLKPPPGNMKQIAANLRDPDIQTPGSIKGWDEWRPAYVQALDKAFSGEESAPQALRNAVTAADAVLARTGPQK
ncbi:MAG TPA: sugar ABC transporter substrate-binding protein [Chloroflexota bacterium]|nr:sugar ABC transporter substrate-binding protein [Chloroflexota bacterium]